MSEASPQDLTAVMESARRLTVWVRKRATPLLAEFGVNVVGRSLLMYLDETGPVTVPQLAQHLLVTRQVTQRLADDLTGAGLIERRGNPRSQRSHLYALTARGSDVLRSIAAAESALLDGLDLEMSAADAGACAATLDRLQSALAVSETTGVRGRPTQHESVRL